MNRFDPSIFDLNQDCKLDIKEIGNLKSRLITVENIFKDPERVKAFLDNIPLIDCIQPNPKGFYPGYQTYFSYELGELQNMLNYYVEETFETQVRGWNTAYQCVDGAKKVFDQSNFPHTDGGQIAGNVFLSDNVEQGSGTRFYRFKQTMEESPIANNCMYRKDLYGYKQPKFDIVDFNPVNSNEQWESYFLAEEKFNCLNMYEGALFHSAYIEPETYTTQLRKSLSFLSA
jgi:hypothetical protein